MGRHMVPGEVAAAVSTRRVELLAPLRHAVKANGGLDAETASSLIDLVRDAILEAIKDDERMRIFVTRVDDMRASAKGTLTSLDNLVSDMTGDGLTKESEDDK